MKLTPLARAAALDLSARLDITFQQALGGLVLLADLDTQLSPDALRFHLAAAFGLIDEDAIATVIERLELAGVLREDDEHAEWWEVTLP